MTRQDLQKEAVDALSQAKRLICQWATGVGKSSVALRFVENHQDYKTLIVVPEVNNIDNWREEFKKFGINDSNVEIICYASLHKYEDTQWDFLVLDEVPHIDTDKRFKVASTILAEYVLALGAVITEEEVTVLEELFGEFLIHIFTMDDAIKYGILPPPTVNIVHMSLEHIPSMFKYNGMNLSAKKMYAILQEKVEITRDAYNRTPNKYTEKAMFTAGLNRKRFLGNLKESAAAFICDELQKKGRRFLCFCASIKQAEKLGKEKAFTSKTPTSAKLLERFNNGEINSLYVVGKLIEGQNLKNIEHGVITQLGGTERITVQSIGRIMRSEKPVIWIPIFDGTKDDSFLYNVTYNIPNDYIKHYKF